MYSPHAFEAYRPKRLLTFPKVPVRIKLQSCSLLRDITCIAFPGREIVLCECSNSHHAYKHTVMLDQHKIGVERCSQDSIVCVILFPR